MEFTPNILYDYMVNNGID